MHLYVTVSRNTTSYTSKYIYTIIGFYVKKIQQSSLEIEIVGTQRLIASLLPTPVAFVFENETILFSPVPRLKRKLSWLWLGQDALDWLVRPRCALLCQLYLRLDVALCQLGAKVNEGTA